MGSTPRPTIDEIEEAWQRDEQHASFTGPRKRAKVSHPEQVDVDILGYFLAGILQHARNGETCLAVKELAMDPEPYKSAEELETYCQSYVQLRSLLAPELLPSCTTVLCRNLVNAGSHNAFGIRAGGEDAEEYMGYGIWPVASYFNHSCAPNVAKKRIGNGWVFRAAGEIAVGDECCITYLGGDEKDLDVRERRARLSEVWGFTCQCCRCVDEVAGSKSA
ncbi:Histone-lysine N-methyltransferase set-6 [Recurvomyces mirabilis]|nr:Histone-lysine N-methyltransferase set-6 [Recurvomyces mirabilis]